MAEEEILEDSHGKNEKTGFEKAMRAKNGRCLKLPYIEKVL